MFTLVALTTLVVAQLGDGPSVDSFGQVAASFGAAADSLPAGPAAKAGQSAVTPSGMLASEEPPDRGQLHADPSVSVAAWSDMSEASPQGTDYLTREQVQAEVKKSAWTKGNMRIVPYGTLWGDMSYDSQRARTGDYCLWIESQSTHVGEADASVDARSTRLGIDVFGPCIPCLGDAKVGGKVEIDFQGYYLTRNKPGLLLRHAYMEAKDQDFRLLVGQTWDVISPLGIPTLNYTAGSAVGNLAYRRAQFRGERFYALSDTQMVTLQGSLNANVVTDFLGETSTSADVGPYPDIQARAAYTLGQRSGCDVPPIVLGFGGHVGEQDFDFRSVAAPDLGVEVPTWSACADFYVPITARWGFQGEFFTGENLSNYMGGILQGVDRLTHKAIHATGGWADIWFKWRPDLCSHFGYALDDPANGDLRAPASRTYNQMIYTNLLYDATKNLQVGMEVDVWKTHYIDLKPGEAVRVECAVKYFF
jgi:hypothetical protein